MQSRSTRRSALAAGLGLALSRVQLGRAAQVGRLDTGAELSWLPALPSDPTDWPTFILTHADMARFWDVRSIEPPRTFDDQTSPQWVEIGQFLPVNEGVMLQYLTLDWESMVGFSLWDADQVTVFGDLPNQVLIYRGRFDPERIADRLTAAGHQAETSGEFTLLSDPTEEVDLSADLDRFTLGKFDHVAASESLVIASRSRTMLEATLAAGTGDAPAIASQPEFSDVAAVLADMTGYVVLNGWVLGSDREFGPVPEDGELIAPARLLIAGITVEERGQTVSLIADLGDPDAAEAAVDIVTAHLENELSPVSKRPYAEDLAGSEVDVVQGTGMVRVTVTNDDFATRWMRYVYLVDLAFLATE